MGCAAERLTLFAFDEQYVRQLQERVTPVEEHFSIYFQKLLTNYLRRRIKSPELIEDIRQETFARTWAALRSERGIRQPERLGSFVNSVCNNVLLEHYRQSSKENPLCDDSIVNIADPATSVSDAISSREMREKVRDILKSLSERDHFLLEEVFLNELDKDEICQRVGVNREYLRVLLYRCKKSFRKVFLKEMETLGKSKLTRRSRENNRQKPSLNEISRVRGPEMDTGAAKSYKPALLGTRRGVTAMPHDKSAVSVAYLRQFD